MDLLKKAKKRISTWRSKDKELVVASAPMESKPMHQSLASALHGNMSSRTQHAHLANLSESSIALSSPPSRRDFESHDDLSAIGSESGDPISLSSPPSSLPRQNNNSMCAPGVTLGSRRQRPRDDDDESMAPAGPPSTTSGNIASPLAAFSEHNTHVIQALLGRKFDLNSFDSKSFTVDVDGLRKACWGGIPPALRYECWCLMLGYYPPALHTRKAVVARKRQEYASFVERAHTGIDWELALDVTKEGDKSVSPDDIATMRQIRKDCPRTFNGVYVLQHPRTQLLLERVLFTWALRHPASGYVQGMNDIVLPFLYVVLAEYYYCCRSRSTSSSATDDESLRGDLRKIIRAVKNEKDAELVASRFSDAVWMEIEADTYWLSSQFLSSVQSNFTFNQAGTHSMVKQLQSIVERCDSALAKHLEDLGLQFAEFAFRWMNCLLLREFAPSRCVRLFDTYLCEAEAFADFHIYVCAVLVTRWGDLLRQSDEFVFVMQFLQSLPTHGMTDSEIGELTSAAFLLQSLYRTGSLQGSSAGALHSENMSVGRRR